MNQLTAPAITLTLSAAWHPLTAQVETPKNAVAVKAPTGATMRVSVARQVAGRHVGGELLTTIYVLDCDHGTRWGSGKAADHSADRPVESGL